MILVVVVVVIVIDGVTMCKSRLTKEIEYAIMCMVIDTVCCVSFMYLSYMPFTALVSCFLCGIKGIIPISL